MKELIYVCILLCTIAVSNTAQNSSDTKKNQSYPPDNRHTERSVLDKVLRSSCTLVSCAHCCIYRLLLKAINSPISV